MNSSANVYPICCHLDRNDDGVVTTECGQTYHRSYAQECRDIKQKTDCPFCGKRLAFTTALDLDKIKSGILCSLCKNPLDPKDDLLMTVCGHRYHRTCAQDRRDIKQKTDCYFCGKELALSKAPNLDMRMSEAQCSICGKSLNVKGDLTTIACGHTCHLTCADYRPNTRHMRDCRVCDKDSAREEMLDQDTRSASSTTAGHRYPNQPESNENVEKMESTTMAITPEASNATDKKKNYWICQKCSMEQDESLTRCGSCGELRYSLPNSNALVGSAIATIEEKHTHKSSKSKDRMYPDLSFSHLTTSDSNFDEPSGLDFGKRPNNSEEEQSSVEMFDVSNTTDMEYPRPEKTPKIETPILTPQRQSSLNLKYETTVYIPDLPLNIEDNIQLEHTIRHRLSGVLSIEPIDVKCYSNFGIGYFRVKNNQIKEHLVNVVGSMAWDPAEKSIAISFKDTIEFVSYIVFYAINKNTNINLPKSDEIVNGWIDNYQGEMPLACDQLNIQYPHIYRIVSKSLDELLRVAEKPDFMIKTQRARVYPCAHCSYFEDLPTSTTENQLQELICNTIGLKKISLSSLYIELNKQMNSACILATNMARKWAKIDSIYIGDESILKKKSLSYHLLLRPVRQKDEADSIIRHEIFAGKAKIIKHSGQYLILKINDKNIYDNCLNSKVLRIGKGVKVSIMIYTGTTNIDSNEIDLDTWYGTEMLESKSDIMSFIQQPEHKIFRLRWNAKIWLEEFDRVKILQREDSRNNDDEQKQGHISGNNMRHLLRVTVMLNTLAAIRKKSYMINDDKIQLKLNKNLKTTVYNHQSKLQHGGPMQIKKTPYEKTEVKVMNEDCLVVYENLVNQGKQPLLLNMASATSPGGGYRKGDGAQEENLFRRSDYFRSLDIDLDKFTQPSARNYRTSTCSFDFIADSRTMYPMDQFGAIYTSGLTVFRQSETEGYEFMEKPLTDVCSLAMAAYRNPPLEENMLSAKYAVGMRKKIENIFAIAYYNKHDSLVLSALGCGAFRNPPDHVAKIFRSVIEQYAGFFELIVFAIIDDHNTGLHFNIEGNFLPFQCEFRQSIFEPIQPTNQANTIFGPYRLLSDGLTMSDVSIYDLKPCNFGAKCRDLYDSNHTRQYSHPPLCIEACVTGTCTKMNDIVHMYSFIHRNKCSNGGQCRDIDDKKHAQEFEHPSYCRNGGACQDTTDDHEKEYRHLPLCKDAHKCKDYQNRVRHHCDSYRHCKLSCQYGRFCAYFHDRQHFEDYQHPFPQPCPWTPYHCVLYDEFARASNIEKLPHNVQQHCTDFAHVCQLGRNCSEKNLSHWKTTIHIARCVCSSGKECIKLDQEDHLNLFTHLNVQDIRYLCKSGSTCPKYSNIKHKTRYRHGLASENTSVIPYYDLNKNINFFSNQQKSILRIMEYMKHGQWMSFTSGSVPEEILDWIRNVQPIHRCRSEVFESILLHKNVMSRQHMEHFKNPKFLAHCILQYNLIKHIKNLKIDTCIEHAKNYIIALIIDEYRKYDFLKTDLANPNDLQSFTNIANVIREEENFLSTNISPDDIKLINKTTIQIAQVSTKLLMTSVGTSDSSDMILQTNKHVLSSLGPYIDNDCRDIIIVFKREILHHPDANFSIQTGKSYLSGRCYKSQPWLGINSNSQDERIKLFHETKLHASILGYEHAAAIQLIALTSHNLCQKTMNIALDRILHSWLNADSQNLIEARLPQLIPLDYIDQIYMTENIYDSFDMDIRHSIQNIFGDRVKILQTKSNEKYNYDIKNALIQQCDKRNIQQFIPKPIQGFVITIPPTNFVDNLVLPLTISQAYIYYYMRNPKPSIDMTIYIYWQTMNGDMMLTLSNEEINSSESQSKMRCLICYIAEKPILTNNQYNEYPSYLNLGQPSEHQIFNNQNRYVATSTSFYRGCNLDDLMTFCLEIQPSYGTVTLSHVGSNSIYNHEIISYTFDKSDIDLTKLEFIHVSAGTRIVSIRNLFVKFEKQNDLHPTIDAKFDNISSSEKISANDVQGDKGHGGLIASSLVVADDLKKRSHDLVDQLKNNVIQIKDQAVNYVFGKKNSSLTPCSQGINCPIQFSDNGSTHNSKYSHPCRFAELCRDHEPHLTHEPRQATLCFDDQKCKRLCDPCHRAKYRHSGLPYFLIPCQNQSQCKDNTERHRIKYSHGEQVLETMGKLSSKESSAASSEYDDRIGQTPCKWGIACRDIKDSQHCKKYSHPIVPIQQQANTRQPDRSNWQRRNHNSNY